jgi:hypothetical protein
LARNQPAVAASSEEIIVESETKIEADREEQQLDAFTLKRLYSEVRYNINTAKQSILIFKIKS